MDNPDPEVLAVVPLPPPGGAQKAGGHASADYVARGRPRAIRRAAGAGNGPDFEPGTSAHVSRACGRVPVTDWARLQRSVSLKGKC
jgi:hypothetical protein